MKVFLAGTRSFGVETFRLLKGLGHEIVGVSAPFGDKLHKEATKKGAHPVINGLNLQTMPDGVDLIVAAHSHDFISRPTRLKARLGAIGYHPSLLPLHRGRDAVEWTLRMGDRVAGGTVYWLNNTVDGGDVAAQDYCFVRKGDTASSLWRRDLFPMGLRLFEQVLGDLGKGIMVREKQDTGVATWEPSIDPPRLYRPDLLEIGPGWEDMTIRTSRHG